MKKLTAVLLAMVLAILPVMGLAATTDELMTAAKETGAPVNTTVTFDPADLSGLMDEETNTIYQELLKALSLNVYSNGDEDAQGGVSVNLQDKPVITLDLAIGEDGTAYLNSNFLGSASVAVAADEWQLLVEKLIDLLVTTGELSESEAAEIKAMLPEFFSGAAMSVENPLENVNFDSLLEKAAAIGEKAEMAEVTQQPEGCDPAVTMMTLTMTAEDVVGIYSEIADALRKSETAMEYINEKLDGEMTAEELLTGMVDAIAEAMSMVQGDMPMVFYMDAEGVPVCVTMDMAMQVENSAVKMNSAYNRLTTDQGVAHTVTAQATENDTLIMDTGLTYLDAGEAGLITFKLIAGYEDEKVELSADAVFDANNLDMSMKMQVSEDDDVAAIGLTAVAINKDNKTDVDVNLTVTEDEETVGIAFAMNEEQIPGDTSASTKGDMLLSMTQDGMSMGVASVYETTVTAGETTVSQTTNDVSLNVLGMALPLLTINTTTEVNGVPATSIASGEAVHVATMTEEELMAFGTQIAQSAQVELVELVQQLPVSILMMMINE